MKNITNYIAAALITAAAVSLTGCKWFKHNTVNAGDPAVNGGVSQSVVESAKFNWCYGGLDGSKAVEDANAQIKDFKISGNNMSYGWAKGNLRGWGLADTSADALACVFFKDGKTFKGGKFEWISYSRKTRQFGNISGHYNGWDPNKFFAATDYAFCICSKDGKKRTNFIFFSKNSREPADELIWIENGSRVVPLPKPAPKVAPKKEAPKAPAKPVVAAKKPEPLKAPAVKPAAPAVKKPEPPKPAIPPAKPVATPPAKPAVPTVKTPAAPAVKPATK